MGEISEKVESAVIRVQRQWSTVPRAAVILGTGLGNFARQIEAEVVIPYADIPGFPRSTALAHKGQLVGGRWKDVPVIVMEGRCHYYEGYSFDEMALPVRVLGGLGAKLCIVSNASGGLNPQYRPGDIMVLDDHVDLMGSRNLGRRMRDSSQTSRIKLSPCYDAGLIERALAIARRSNFACHRGVYVSVTGPSYETRAEYRFLRRIGGDAVGMSTVPEVLVARECGMRVLALSAITNVARPDAADTIDAQDVVDIATHAEPKLRAIVLGVLGDCSLSSEW